MPLPTATKNDALHGLDIDFVSLHSGFPGTTGANEISGGAPAYARIAATMGAESGGQRLLSAPAVFDVPAATVRWVGYWKSGVFIGTTPNGGATPKNFMAVPSTGVFYATGHGWSDTQKIVFFGIPPTGLTEGTVYFVRDAATDSFKVAATSGGAAITISSAPSFGCVVVSIVEQVYATQDTHTLTMATFALPD